jgi:gluconolactonase
VADEFAAALGAAPRLERVVDVDAHEGPVYVPAEDALYFTSLPAADPGTAGGPLVAIKRLALDGTRFPLERERLSVVVPDANGANGMALDRAGHLVVCEQGSPSRAAGIARLDPRTGEREVVVDSWRGLAQLAQRRGGPQRRHDLVHRPQLRLPATGPSSPLSQQSKGA